MQKQFSADSNQKRVRHEYIDNEAVHYGMQASVRRGSGHYGSRGRDGWYQESQRFDSAAESGLSFDPNDNAPFYRPVKFNQAPRFSSKAQGYQ